MKLDEFTRSYIATMLWSTSDESDDQGGEPLDRNYTESDLAPETLARIVADCAAFQAEMDGTISDSLSDWERAGHDFWLTRNGHGCGFWDGDWPEPHATKLTNASKRFGVVYVYVADGQIYMTPEPKAFEKNAE